MKSQTQYEIVPLGEAFLCLQGAIENLENAIKSKKSPLILKRRIILENEIRAYEHAAKNSKKNSFIAHRYLIAGKSDLTHAVALLEEASQFLSSCVALV